jgi:hypothetical protein
MLVDPLEMTRLCSCRVCLRRLKESTKLIPRAWRLLLGIDPFVCFPLVATIQILWDLGCLPGRIIISPYFLHPKNKSCRNPFSYLDVCGVIEHCVLAFTIQRPLLTGKEFLSTAMSTNASCPNIRGNPRGRTSSDKLPIIRQELPAHSPHTITSSYLQ